MRSADEKSGDLSARAVETHWVTGADNEHLGGWVSRLRSGRWRAYASSRWIGTFASEASATAAVRTAPTLAPPKLPPRKKPKPKPRKKPSKPAPVRGEQYEVRRKTDSLVVGFVRVAPDGRWRGYSTLADGWVGIHRTRSLATLAVARVKAPKPIQQPPIAVAVPKLSKDQLWLAEVTDNADAIRIARSAIRRRSP